MPEGGAVYRQRMKEKSKNKGFLEQLGASLAAAFYEATEDTSNMLLYELCVKWALPRAVLMPCVCIIFVCAMCDLLRVCMCGV